MNIPEQYYGLAPSEWPDHLWETEFKGMRIQGKLTSLNHSPSGALVFSVAETDEESSMVIVVVGPYQRFRPVFSEQSGQEEDESEETWKRRIIKHDMMASGLKHLEDDPGGAILLG